jgi:hypothetical protein
MNMGPAEDAQNKHVAKLGEHEAEEKEKHPHGTRL